MLYSLDVPSLHTPNNMKAIQNLKVENGECMTSTDYKLRKAIKVAREYGLGIKDIVPKRENGLIVGYYVINEGGETAVATIE
jgi:hypothetical protein